MRGGPGEVFDALGVIGCAGEGADVDHPDERAVRGKFLWIGHHGLHPGRGGLGVQAAPRA